MRIDPVLAVVTLALGCSGCANLTTKDRFSNLLRISCDARENATTTTLKATLFATDAKEPADRLDLTLTDRLSIRGGKYGAGLSWHTDMHDHRDGEVTRTHAYEAAIPTDPARNKLEIGFTRGESDAVWTLVPMPTPPELTLTGEDRPRLAWPPSSTGTQDTLEIFVACDDGPPPKEETARFYNGAPPPTPAAVAARYKPSQYDEGIDVDALLSLAARPSAPNSPVSWDACATLSVVAVRSAKVELPTVSFGKGECSVESSRGIQVQRKKPALTVPADSAAEGAR